MVKVLCKYAKISDIPNLYSLDYYKEMIRPLDYDFYLTVGIFYEVLGVVMRSGIPWLYIIRDDDNFNIDILPAILFDYSWNKVPSSWLMRINGPSKEDIELLPEKLTSIENWFEKYTDEDPNALGVLSLIIHNNRSKI
ncbi:hypothetical protein [Candidatus Paracaedibacter symbiosus]|uniref:hypothetical protein n=1 Tax=Candidatus Paracaedibacter symbiosus TaxID=244582 RepID=UPI000509698E|nr:hypothetical protein [Candidatus Paracaedibacter symbiosus]